MKNIISRYAWQEDDKSKLINAGFLKVLVGIKKYDESLVLSTWIRTIMVNSCIDEFRKTKSKEMELHLEDLKNTPVAISYNQALKDLEQEDVIRMLDVLPYTSRNVFNLYVIDGYKHAEIGELLNISSGTSRWHLNFARGILKKALNESTLNEVYIKELAG